MLDPTDLEKGDELVCIDPDGYLNQNPMSAHFRGKVLSMPIIFNGIQNDKGLILTNEPYLIPFDALRFFVKKSEEQICDFSALIDTAVQAMHDGVIMNVAIDKHGVNICVKASADILKFQRKNGNFKEAIIEIKSLYNETFVIDISNNNIDKVKIGAKVKRIPHGTESVIEDQAMLDALYNTPYWILNGLIIEQPK